MVVDEMREWTGIIVGDNFEIESRFSESIENDLRPEI
jgi:hypothetical protein